jgi:DNA-binding NarL/FixJ family response regulator
MSTLDCITPMAARNCCRCGSEFLSTASQRVCGDCREPVSPRVPSDPRRLSFREAQIVDLVRQARLNKEIAFELHLSEGTIKEYLNRLFRKLGVKNRTELAVWSITNLRTGN